MIQLDQKTSLTLVFKINVLCDERQKRLIEEKPDRIILLPENAVIKSVAIVDHEIVEGLNNENYKHFILERI